MRTAFNVRAPIILPLAMAAVLLVCILMPTGMASSSMQLFDRSTVDLGEMPEGQALEFRISLINMSGSQMITSAIEVSCGCTEAEALSNSVAPGKALPILIRIDTAGKSGRFLKVLDIYTNLQPEPFELSVTGYVKHADTPSEPGAIFRGKCAACHLGKDLDSKSPDQLYDALCYICHKENYPGGRSGKPDQAMHSAIANGITETPMPGFSERTRGPLNDRQIDSLVDYLRTRK